MKEKKQMLFSILGLLLLLVVTFGSTYAFFNYSKTGTVDNVIQTGTLSFSYTDVTNGINLTNAVPISDEAGKAQTGSGNVFDFTISSNTSAIGMNYTVRAVKSSTSTLTEDDYVKLYLTDITTGTESVIVDATTYQALPNHSAGGKTLYTASIPQGETNYSKSFRLRMWVDQNVDFSDNSLYGKTFVVKIVVDATNAS